MSLTKGTDYAVEHDGVHYPTLANVRRLRRDVGVALLRKACSQEGLDVQSTNRHVERYLPSDGSPVLNVSVGAQAIDAGASVIMALHDKGWAIVPRDQLTPGQVDHALGVEEPC